MPRFLLRLDDDLFVEWSTIVDAPVSRGMTEAEVRDFLAKDPTRAEVDKPAALERLLKTGTSHVYSSDYNLDGALCCNRAGPGERKLTKRELIAQVRREMIARMTTDDKPAPEVLKMMADRDLCEPCATRMATLPPGFVGSWICAACSARHAAKDAAEAAARKALGHPAPWRCEDGGPNGNANRVLDANDAEVIVCEDRYESVWFADEGAKELVLAAPEMEALLRRFGALALAEEAESHRSECHCPFCDRRALLARIDAAKAGG